MMNSRSLIHIGLLMALCSLLLYGLGSALTPLLIAFFLAYLFFPIIHKIETFGIKRQYTVLGVFVIFGLISLLFFILFVPNLINESKYLINEMPNTATKGIERLDSLAKQLGLPFEINQSSLTLFIKEHMTEISTHILSGLSSRASGMLTNTLNILLSILNLFLIPLFFYYLINDYEKILETLKSSIPSQWKPQFSYYLKVSNEVSKDYIRGQLLVAGILALLYGIGLSIVGLKFGLIIGILSGLLSIIPYAGFSIGFITSLIIGFANYDDLNSLIYVVIVFAIVQALEGTVITPKLVGKKVGLSALTTMLSIIIGGNLLGVMGMLISIPCAAIFKKILSDYKNENSLS